MSSPSIPLSHTILTPRCRLRAPHERDIPHIFDATRTPGFNDGMLWDAPASPDELRTPLANHLQAWAEGKAFGFTIESLHEGDFLGRIGIRATEAGGLWNIGFFLHPKHQGQGYMREAAGAILRFGFEALGADMIEACHAVWNTASRRVLEAIGMTFREHLPQGYQKRGQWVAEDRLAIDHATWEALAP